jgi:hypothetical protein
VIQLIVSGAELEVWRSAASAMPEERVASLMPDLRELVRDAFPGLAPSVGDEDLVRHTLGPTFGAYQFAGGRVRALATADSFDLEHGRTLYFSLSAIHSSLRGRGLYEQMLLLRIAIGRSMGCQWWATRTQSPIVGHSFDRFGCYPWLDDEITPIVATEVSAVLYEEFSALGRREGEMFNPTTGVLHDAYPTGPYETIPAVDNARVRAHFDAYVDSSSGDALLLVGKLDDMVEQLAPRCDARFGMPFDQLCELLHDL